MYSAGDVRVETVPDARLIEPTDALVAITRAAICGSDLWPYKNMEHSETGQRMGHEFIGVVEAVGAEVARSGRATSWSPRSSGPTARVFCQELQTSCLHGGRWGSPDVDGGQGEAVRVPQADGTLVVLPVNHDDALMPSLLTLSDVMGTGHHAALAARVGPGKTVAVVGDGAVGLCGVIAASRLGAEQIIMLGRHPERIALAREFGATDIVAERGDAAIDACANSPAASAPSVLECVGYEESTLTARASLGLAARSPRRRSAGRIDTRSGADVLQQHHHRRRPARPRLHRGVALTSSKARSSRGACSIA
jgi:threonine dehydrogenase-like Zn-dependent dehydrogenase